MIDVSRNDWIRELASDCLAYDFEPCPVCGSDVRCESFQRFNNRVFVPVYQIACKHCGGAPAMDPKLVEASNLEEARSVWNLQAVLIRGRSMRQRQSGVDDVPF